MQASKPIYYLFFTLLLLLASCKNEPKPTASGDALYQQSENAAITISKKNGVLFLEKNEIHFDVLEYVGEKPATLLVSTQTIESQSLASNLPDSKSFKLKVKSIEGVQEVAWEKEVKGADINYDLKVVNLHTAATDQQEDSYTFFDIANGKKIMDFTYGELKVLIPNTSEKRFLTYLSATNSLGQKVEGGIIQYADNHGLISSIQLFAKDKKLIPNYTPEIQILKVSDSGSQLTPDGKSIVLTALDQHFKKEDIKGFAFKIVLYDENLPEPYTILLPVDNDALDLKNATYEHSIFTLKPID